MYATNFIIMSDGSLWGCGMNNYGQLGIGSKQSNPVYGWQLISAEKWIKVCGSQYHTLAIKSDGTLWSWGNNSYGQLGTGDYMERLIPTQIGSGKWIDISIGERHSAAISEERKLYTWGDNTYGQLGLGDFSIRNAPTMTSIDRCYKVSCGTYHTLITRVESKDFMGCGLNNTYQLGQNNTNNYNSFVVITNGVIEFSAGTYHTVFIKKDGSLYGCGSRMFGELKLPTNPSYATTPILLDSSYKWKKIICNDKRTAGLRKQNEDYIVLEWFGYNIGENPVFLSDSCYDFWFSISGICYIDYNGMLKGKGNGYFLGLNSTDYFDNFVELEVLPIKTRVGYKNDWGWDYFKKYMNYPIGTKNNWVWGRSGNAFILNNKKEFKIC